MGQLSLNVLQPASAKWISERIETLLSHYFKPDQAPEVTEAAMVDWVEALRGYPETHIEHACQRYLRTEPTKRPTPAAIIAIISKQTRAAGSTADRGDRSKLSVDELERLNNHVLPGARRMLENPSLAKHGRKILAYWGEA